MLKKIIQNHEYIQAVVGSLLAVGEETSASLSFAMVELVTADSSVGATEAGPAVALAGALAGAEPGIAFVSRGEVSVSPNIPLNRHDSLK